jgi:hypothetical protein
VSLSHHIRRRGDHRHVVGDSVRDIDLAAVRAHRHAEGTAADRDSGIECIRRRGDHRHRVVGLVRDIDLAAVGASRLLKQVLAGFLPDVGNLG